MALLAANFSRVTFTIHDHAQYFARGGLK